MPGARAPFACGSGLTTTRVFGGSPREFPIKRRRLPPGWQKRQSTVGSQSRATKAQGNGGWRRRGRRPTRRWRPAARARQQGRVPARKRPPKKRGAPKRQTHAARSRRAWRRRRGCGRCPPPASTRCPASTEAPMQRMRPRQAGLRRGSPYTSRCHSRASSADGPAQTRRPPARKARPPESVTSCTRPFARMSATTSSMASTVPPFRGWLSLL